MKFVPDRAAEPVEIASPLIARVVEAPDHPGRAHVEVAVDPDFAPCRGPRTSTTIAEAIAAKVMAGEDITLADYEAPDAPPTGTTSAESDGGDGGAPEPDPAA